MAAPSPIKAVTDKLRLMKSLENALSKSELCKPSVYQKFAADERVDASGKPLLGAGAVTALTAIIAAINKKTTKGSESAKKKHASLLQKVTDQVDRLEKRRDALKLKEEEKKAREAIKAANAKEKKAKAAAKEKEKAKKGKSTSRRGSTDGAEAPKKPRAPRKKKVADEAAAFWGGAMDDAHFDDGASFFSDSSSGSSLYMDNSRY